MTRRLLAFIATFAVLGCDGSPLRPDLSEPPCNPPADSSRGALWGMVFDSVTDRCLDSATVRVVDGPDQGQTAEHVGPCDYWGYDNGFVFRDLTPNLQMTLTIAAVGYQTRDFVVTPSACTSLRVTAFSLTKE